MSYDSFLELARVGASKRSPYIIRYTMLYNCWRWDVPRCARPENGKDVHLPYNVSMRLKLTSRTAVIASLGFVSMLTIAVFNSSTVNLDAV